MTRNEFDNFQKTLEARLADVRPSLSNREGMAIEKTADALDEVLFATQRELVTRNLERESKLARDLRAAIDRIQDGTYGICAHCEEEIGSKRLAAIPWADYCIRCQQQLDREGHDRKQAHLVNVA